MTKRTTIINVASINNQAINDHTGKPVALLGICILKNGELGALLDTDKYYSINEFYTGNDGLAHISTRSITGTVEPGMDMSTETGVIEFNKTIAFESRYIDRVVVLKR